MIKPLLLIMAISESLLFPVFSQAKPICFKSGEKSLTQSSMNACASKALMNSDIKLRKEFKDDKRFEEWTSSRHLACRHMSKIYTGGSIRSMKVSDCQRILNESLQRSMSTGDPYRKTK